MSSNLIKKILIIMLILMGVIIVGLAGYFVWLTFLSSRLAARPAESYIQIGAVLPLTGTSAGIGTVMENGASLAVREINAAGGIQGRKVELLAEDDHGSPASSTQLFLSLVSQASVRAVIGGVTGPELQALMPEAEALKTTLVSPSVVRAPISAMPNDQTFLMSGDISYIMASTSQYFLNSGIRSLAVIHRQIGLTPGQQDDTFNALTDMLKQQGKRTLDVPYVFSENIDFDPLVLALRKQKVDAVFLEMTGDEVSQFLAEAASLKYAPTVIAYEDAFESLVSEGLDPRQMNGAVIFDRQAGPQPFADKYHKEYKVEPSLAAYRAYDAVYVLAQAIADHIDRASLADYIGSTTFASPIDASIRFDADHALPSIPLRIEIVNDGEAVPLSY